MWRLLLLLLLTSQLEAQSIYRTPSGKKYHLSTCRMVENVSHRITVAEAKQSALQPCKICKPANIYTTTSPIVNKAKGTGQTVQCRGTTKNGTRCRHQTRIANGYCYQHQP